MLFDTVLVLTILAVLTATFFYFIPWAFKLISIYGLHALRDRLFQLAEAFPEARGTTLFRSLDGVLAELIHTIRDKKVIEHRVARLDGEAMSPGAEELSRRYKQEFSDVYATTDEGVEAFMELKSCAAKFVVLRFATGHPVLMILALLGVTLGLGARLGSLVSTVTTTPTAKMGGDHGSWPWLANERDPTYTAKTCPKVSRGPRASRAPGRFQAFRFFV